MVNRTVRTDNKIESKKSFIYIMINDTRETRIYIWHEKKKLKYIPKCGSSGLGFFSVFLPARTSSIYTTATSDSYSIHYLIWQVLHKNLPSQGFWSFCHLVFIFPGIPFSVFMVLGSVWHPSCHKYYKHLVHNVITMVVNPWPNEPPTPLTFFTDPFFRIPYLLISFKGFSSSSTIFN